MKTTKTVFFQSIKSNNSGIVQDIIYIKVYINIFAFYSAMHIWYWWNCFNFLFVIKSFNCHQPVHLGTLQEGHCYYYPHWLIEWWVYLIFLICSFICHPIFLCRQSSLLPIHRASSYLLCCLDRIWTYMYVIAVMCPF